MDPHALCGNSTSAGLLQNSCAASSPHIGMLPLEILQLILLYLSPRDKVSAAQVSKTWHWVAYQPSLWCGQTARLSRKSWSPSLIPSLDSRQIQHVSVSRACTAHDLRDLVTGVSSLKKLDLVITLDAPTDALDNEFDQHLLKLTHFSLFNIGTAQTVPDQICEHARNLRTLKMTYVQTLTAEHLKSINANLRNLETLTLASCLDITDNGIFNLAGMNSEGECVSPMPSLQNLTLDSCHLLTSAAVRAVRAGFPNLRSLNLWACNSLNPDCMTYVAKLTKLEDLTITKQLLTSSSLRMLSQGYLPTLASLELNLTHKLTDEGLSYLPRLSSICQLTLAQCSISLSGILQVARHLHNLERLILKGFHSCSYEDVLCLKSSLDMGDRKVDVVLTPWTKCN